MVTLPKIKKFVGKYLTVEQGNVLLEVSKDTPMETVVILGMMYGLRRSEIAGLMWSALDFENNTLTVCHTVTKFKTVVARDGTMRYAHLDMEAKENVANRFTEILPLKV